VKKKMKKGSRVLGSEGSRVKRGEDGSEGGGYQRGGPERAEGAEEKGPRVWSAKRKMKKKGPRVLGSEGSRVRTAKRKMKSDTEITEGGRRYTEQRGRGME